MTSSPAPPTIDDPDPRPRTYGRWRAATLIFVHVLIGLHIAHWQITGRSLAPLEFSEAMATLELGIVTAGFLFMALTIVATAIFGRFFCSWGCHILALEDLCAWLLKKVGIRPKPVRSRMLLFVPPLALFYMFIWPQVSRFLEGRPLPEVRLAGEGEAWAMVTDDFWHQMPPFWVAVFTFLVCGFLIVYVLGSRSFCRYGCPYGAIFAMADVFAPGRLVRTRSCDGCGKCTAACQSGVDVHRELDAYGTVMDAGCLKALDCLGACPTGAIGFRFTKPSLFRRRRIEGAPKRQFDFSFAEDLGLAVAFAGAFFTFRGLYGLVPFLLSLAVAGIYAHGAVLAYRLARRETVKLGRTQLKVQGRWTRAGKFFAVGAVACGGLFVHSTAIRTNEWLGERAFNHRHEETGSSTTALRHLEEVERWGLASTPEVDRMLATLHLEGADPARAEPYLRRRLERYPEDRHSRLHLARALFEAGRVEEAEEQVTRVLEEAGNVGRVAAECRELLGSFRASQGELEGAILAYQAALVAAADSPGAHRALGELFASMKRFEEAVGHLTQAIELAPEFAPTQYNLAVLLAQLDRDPEAIERYRIAAELQPSDAETWNNLGFLLAKHDQLAEAESCFRRAIEIDESFAHPHFNLGQLLLIQGREVEAVPEFRRAAELDTRYAEVLGG